jgi:hypothetical protein
MAKSVTPPQGSKISVTIDGPDELIVIPQKSGGVMRYLSAIFVAGWLVVWTFAFGGSLGAAYTGSLQTTGGSFTVVFIFAVMAFGEVTAIIYLYRLLRPAAPEMLWLRADGISYDSGVPSFQFQMVRRYVNDPDFWRVLFPKRWRLELSRQEARSVRLRETDSGNRLTYDLGSSRIDIATGASEIEREWLARVLSERYS